MQQSHGSIVLVDDDQSLSEMLAEYLQQEGFEVTRLFDGESAIKDIQPDSAFQLIVLDIMMPGLNGLDVLQHLRQQQIQTPVIMLTGRGDDIDRILGLEMGADDYLSKPCNPRELLARIRALLRRSQLTSTASSDENSAPTTLHIGSVKLDPSQRQAWVNDQALELTSAEFNVLQILMQSAGEVISKELLTRQVLQRELSAYDRSIDVHVSRIRKKIQTHNTGKPDAIKTLRNLGYQFLKHEK